MSNIINTCDKRLLNFFKVQSATLTQKKFFVYCHYNHNAQIIHDLNFKNNGFSYILFFGIGHCKYLKFLIKLKKLKFDLQFIDLLNTN